MSPAGELTLIPVPGLPEIESGNALGEMIASAAALADGDVLAVAQKVVSKAEGRTARPADVEPGERARELAERLGKDPGLVELILRESARIVRDERVLIVETHGGLVCANAGIDSSNSGDGETVVLLPSDPDASARRLRAEIQEMSGRRLAVVITDSFGRPWRVGQAEVAIGCAGLHPLDDWRGRDDRDGRELAATEIALADEIAAASDLVRDKVAGVPVVIVRGLAERVTEEDGPGAAALRRAAAEDLFR
jgi:coenzyme F420-0:L-glutamate ligase/coenzyme F420-1:gamma-L-glutamate ligase